MKQLCHMHEHGVTAGNDKGKEREIVFRFAQEIGIEVPFHVVDAHEGDAEAVCHGFAEIESDEQCADQAGTVRGGYSIQLAAVTPRSLQGLLHHLDDEALVRA